MKKPLLHLLLICLCFGCSSSDSTTAMDLPGVAEDMERDPAGPDGEGSVESETIVVFTGEFMNGGHPTSSTAIVNLERTHLDLINFKSDDGPTLELYISTALDATDYISLGELHGLEGDFTYILPAGINFETHNHMMV